MDENKEEERLRRLLKEVEYNADPDYPNYRRGKTFFLFFCLPVWVVIFTLLAIFHFLSWTTFGLVLFLTLPPLAIAIYRP